MSSVRLGRVMSLSTQPASAESFKLGLESIESGTGRRLDSVDGDYEGEGVKFRTGDVLFGKLRPYLAKVWLADRDGAAVGDFHVYRPTPRIEARFLRYVLLSRAFLDLVTASVTGAKMPRTDWNFVRQFETWLPDLTTQCAIADYLDRETAQIEALIEKQRQLIGTLGERRAEIIADQFNITDSRTTDRLKRMAAVQTGVTLGGPSADDHVEMPYLRVANVQVGYVDLNEVKVLELPRSVVTQYLLQRGDVLMTEGGDIDKLGRGSIWNGQIDPCTHQNHVFAVRPGKRLDPNYLVYYLDSPKARIYFRMTARKTTNLASTNKWTLGNLPISAPPLEVQRRVVQELDFATEQIGALTDKAQRFIELTRERRSALITAAVTGQIDVRSAA